ncbi:hypothetical protein HK104_003565 [Borealophlyctis nickersoniae]|nr:hypothetical protein HK104_003565 [Borealophlyctis nickersoniae]
MAGVATHYVPSERIPALVERLCGMQTSDLRAINLVVQEFVGNGPSKEEWEAWALHGHLRLAFERCFTQETLEGIFSALEEENSPWAKDTLERMRKQSPTSMKVTVEQLKRAKKMDIASTFRMEYRIAYGFLHTPDLQTGVKAVLTDKHGEMPQWNPTLEDVLSGKALSDEEVRVRYFGDKDEEIRSSGKDSKYAPYIPPEGFGLVLHNDRTFMQYPHRTVTGLPAEEDVRKVVAGETSGSGTFALTEEEVIDWFTSYWGTFMNSDTLAPLSVLPPSMGAQKCFDGTNPDPAEPKHSGRGRRKEIWPVRQRVAGILATRTKRVGENDAYLRWKQDVGSQ